MRYWIAFKNGEYVSGTDEFGYPYKHTKNEKEAYKFYDFNLVMSKCFNLGYAIIKRNDKMAFLPSQCVRYIKRVIVLLKRGWFKNMAGGFTEGHCRCFLSKKELFTMTDNEFESIK